MSGHEETVWNDIIKEYSGHKLTNFEDRLPAIAGIAGELQKKLKYSYVAGMWVETLQQNVLWEILDEDEDYCPVPQQYIAPSWSWAAVNRQVICPFESRKWTAKLTSCKVSLVNPGVPFGQVKEGFLIIRGETCLESQAIKGEFSGSRYTPRWNHGSPAASNLNMLLRVIHNTVKSRQTPRVGSSGFILQPVEDGTFRRVGVFSYDTQVYSFDSPKNTPAKKLDWITREVVIV